MQAWLDGREIKVDLRDAFNELGDCNSRQSCVWKPYKSDSPATEVSTVAKENDVGMLSMFHEALGGMQGDKNMFRYLRDNPDKYNAIPSVFISL